MSYTTLPHSLRCRIAYCFALAAAVTAAATTAPARGQAPSPDSAAALHFRVDGPSQRLEMIVNTSRILTLDKKIPRLQVNNPELVQAQPLSPYKVQLAALRPGVTQINLWDENDEIHTVDVLILGDARELQMLLESQFPNSSLKVRPLASSVVISGFVDRPESVSRIVRMSEDYYPKIINNITVGGVQQVMLHVKVLEVSRTKLRKMGFDWAEFNGNDFITSRAAGILTPPNVNVGNGITGNLSSTADTVRFGIVDGSNAFFGFLEALRTYNMAKLLAEPTLVTVSGRPASFNVGGQFPILIPGGLGTVSIQYKEFGTRVDFVPIVLGNGNIRLEVRPAVTERDDAAGVNGVPAIRERWVDTAAEMKAGQTLALAGLVQQQVEAENRGVPFVSDLPWIGGAFRSVRHRINETELLVLVTPELIAPMNPHQVPQCLPGSFTTNPTDCELYGRGYIEVPKCCDGIGLSCDGSGYGCGGLGCSGCADCKQGGVSYGEATPAYETYSPTPANVPPQAAPVVPVPAPGLEDPAASWQPRRVPATPSSYNQSSPTGAGGSRSLPSANSQPRLIGPLGYDVLD